jgi:hypothetical protein
MMALSNRWRASPRRPDYLQTVAVKKLPNTRCSSFYNKKHNILFIRVESISPKERLRKSFFVNASPVRTHHNPKIEKRMTLFSAENKKECYGRRQSALLIRSFSTRPEFLFVGAGIM